MSTKTKEVVRDSKDALVDAAKRVGEATRAAWKKTKAAVSEDPTVYREGANQKLGELGKEISELKGKALANQPPYFQIRLQALDQHHEYVTANLAKLTPEQIRVRMSGSRHALDQSIENLEDAIDQAKNEADDLAKAAQK